MVTLFMEAAYQHPDDLSARKRSPVGERVACELRLIAMGFDVLIIQQPERLLVLWTLD